MQAPDHIRPGKVIRIHEDNTGTPTMLQAQVPRSAQPAVLYVKDPDPVIFGSKSVADLRRAVRGSVVNYQYFQVSPALADNRRKASGQVWLYVIDRYDDRY